MSNKSFCIATQCRTMVKTSLTYSIFVDESTRGYRATSATTARRRPLSAGTSTGKNGRPISNRK